MPTPTTLLEQIAELDRLYRNRPHVMCCHVDAKLPALIAKLREVVEATQKLMEAHDFENPSCRVFCPCQAHQHAQQTITTPMKEA